MRSANLANQASRQAEVGQVWIEKLSGAMGTLEMHKYSTFRVRAAAGTTVTIDGVLAMTMMLNEIAIFNAGGGDNLDTKNSVTVVIAGAAAYVQIARDKER